jgi:hypothetical protein
MPDQRHGAALQAEARHWAARRSADPYDRAARENLARVLFAMQGERFAPGTVERGRLLLAIMADAFPTPVVCDAYVDNLQRLLPARSARPMPGRVVLGLGAGRCGSTSLTALVAGGAETCATHENPPLLYWPPLDVQLGFHLRRFELLAQRFALVFDAAHWWLGAVETVFARFPGAALIGLYRDAESCARSFLQIKGAGPGSLNHWAPPGNGLWRPSLWDPVYPGYRVPEGAARDPDAAKLAMIRRYVDDYNQRLRTLAERWPARVLLVATESLGAGATQRQIFEFLGLAATPSTAALNVATVADGDSQFRF